MLKYYLFFGLMFFQMIVAQAQDPCATHFYSIGNVWNYETVQYIGGDHQIIDFKEIEIIDTEIIDEQEAFRLSNGDLFYSDGAKVYFWDEGLQRFEMYYDFDNTDSYSIRFYDQFRQDTFNAEIVINETYNVEVDGLTYSAQDVTVIGSGNTTEAYDATFYSTVGVIFDGPKIDLDCGLCDPTVFTTSLRCYSWADCTSNFLGYDCDSTFSITSVDNLIYGQISIHPNPVNSELNISSEDPILHLKLYDINGNLLHKNSYTSTIDVSLLPSGMYLLSIETSKQKITKKVIKN